MGNDEIDPALRRRAAAFLDEETASLDPATGHALAAARARAAQARRQSRVAWGGAGLALAAGLAAFVVLPRAGSPDLQAEALAATLIDADVVLASEQDTALADDLAFIAWLEENDDPN